MKAELGDQRWTGGVTLGQRLIPLSVHFLLCKMGVISDDSDAHLLVVMRISWDYVHGR